MFTARAVALLLLGEAAAYNVRLARPQSTEHRRAQAITAQASEELMAIRAPLRMAGPYPVISLRFPSIATPEQFKEQQKLTGETGVALDFVIDTAANVNTINAKLAADLGLKAVGYEGPGVSAAGALGGGSTFMLGECQLNDLPKEGRFPLMSGLVASALPVASPGGAGRRLVVVELVPEQSPAGGIRGSCHRLSLTRGTPLNAPKVCSASASSSPSRAA